MPDQWFQGEALSTPLMTFFQDHDVIVGKGERKLGGSFVLPPFQRPAVWTLDQKVKLVESLWDGLPIASFVLNRSNLGQPGDNWLIDGQQRWSAIFDYINDAFPIYGYHYSEITVIDRRRFEMITFPCIRLHLTDIAVLKKIYDRLAYGGTPHAPQA